MRAPPIGPDVLGDALLKEIAERGGVRHFPAHAILINEGDTADSLYILLRGRVKVFSTSAEGKEIIISTHGAGEYLGELSLDGGVRSASVMTLEPTVCSVVTGVTLREFIEAHPAFAMHLIRGLIRRVRQATDSVKSLALEDVYGRVRRLLEEMSVPAGDERVIHERLTQQDIADRVGSSREMISRILRELTAGGYLSTASGRITLHRTPPLHW